MEKIDKLDKQIMEIISANARIPSRMLLPFAVYHGQPSINVFSV